MPKGGYKSKRAIAGHFTSLPSNDLAGSPRAQADDKKNSYCIEEIHPQLKVSQYFNCQLFVYQKTISKQYGK